MSSDDDSQTKLAPDALASLPVFPLPNMVLFPGAMLPLHIFEPRYKEMIRDVMAGDRLLAMAYRKEDEVPGGPPPAIAQIVGIGEIVASEALAEGRFNILLEGRARGRVGRELHTGKPYRSVSVEQLVDDPGDDASPARKESSEAALRALIEEVALRLEDDDALALRKAVREPVSVARLTDRLASVLVTDGFARQALLETLNPWLRMDRLSREVASLLARMRPGAALN
ncbi:MAG: LON peptidase substrate-binding domain-containing protein [Deltaproteobacteria bacterium]|nr:LON peptidase substrate-binding domain-containing protein [Deltaproteobacteria bacterium]